MATTRVYRQLNANSEQESVTAAKTLTASDSGKTFLLPAAGKAITLPAVTAGVHFKFICSVTATSDWTIINGADVMYGSAEVAGAVVACSAKDIVTLVTAKFLPGDFIFLESDGTNWYVSGSVVTTAGCTFTT
jgi:hypothetical protein